MLCPTVRFVFFDVYGIIVTRHLGSSANLAIPSNQLSNAYKFSAYRVAAATVNGSALVVMDTKQFDTGTNFSTGTGVFTAPIAGFYWFYGQLTSSGNPTYMWADIIKNGTSVRRGNRESASNGNGIQVSVGMLIQLASNDTVGLGATTGSLVSLEVGDALKCYFDGFLVSKT